MRPPTPDLGQLPERPSPRVKKSVLRSFRYAWEGVCFVFTTQRHMRAHVLMIGLVLSAAWGLGVNTYELLHLLTAFAMVLITEMINTAIEQTVDLSVNTYDPRAKVAKDVAAGAVMIAAAYSVMVAALGISSSERFWDVLNALPQAPPRPHMGALQAVVIGLILMAIFIVWVKRRNGRGTLWRGGVVSGHSALGFMIATSIVVLTRNSAVACLALALAVLISQSRIQARIHSPQEVVLGGLLGIIVGIVVFLPTDVGLGP